MRPLGRFFFTTLPDPSKKSSKNAYFPKNLKVLSKYPIKRVRLNLNPYGSKDIDLPFYHFIKGKEKVKGKAKGKHTPFKSTIYIYHSVIYKGFTPLPLIFRNFLK